MPLVAVTSQVRYSGRTAHSGFLRIVELDDGRTLLTEHVPESPWRGLDHNPRGGLRGAKGLSVLGDRLVVTNTDMLFVFDGAWTKLAEITHPFAGSVHDIVAEEDAVWVTCTRADLLLKLDWEGNAVDYWSPRSDPALAASLGIDGLPPFDPAVDYRDPLQLQGGAYNVVHLNSVARTSEGLLLFFGRVLRGSEVRRRHRRAAVGRMTARLGIYRPSPEPPLRSRSSSAVVLLRGVDGPLEHAEAELLLRVEETFVPNHNVLEAGGLLVYGDSNGNRLVGVDPATGKEEAVVDVPGGPAFVRGLIRLANGLFLVGSQKPLAFYAVDLLRGRVEETYRLDGEENECVHALCVLPPTFGDPSGIESIFARGPVRVAS